MKKLSSFIFVKEAHEEISLLHARSAYELHEEISLLHPCSAYEMYSVYVASGLWLCYHSTFVLLFTFLFFLPE